MVLFDNAAYEYFFNPLCCKNKKFTMNASYNS